MTLAMEVKSIYEIPHESARYVVDKMVTFPARNGIPSRESGVRSWLKGELFKKISPTVSVLVVMFDDKPVGHVLMELQSRYGLPILFIWQLERYGIDSVDVPKALREELVAEILRTAAFYGTTTIVAHALCDDRANYFQVYGFKRSGVTVEREL